MICVGADGKHESKGAQPPSALPCGEGTPDIRGRKEKNTVGRSNCALDRWNSGLHGRCSLCGKSVSNHVHTSSLRLSSISEHLDLCNSGCCYVAVVVVVVVVAPRRVGVSQFTLAPSHYVGVRTPCDPPPPPPLPESEREEARQGGCMPVLADLAPYRIGDTVLGGSTGTRALADFLPFWMPIIGRDRLRRQVCVDSTWMRFDMRESGQSIRLRLRLGCLSDWLPTHPKKDVTG